VFEAYRQGLQTFITALGDRHPQLAQVHILQQRLLDNLQDAATHGDTETLRNDRARILDELNQLSLQTTGKPLADHCPPLPDDATTPPQPNEPHTQHAQANHGGMAINAGRDVRRPQIAGRDIINTLTSPWVIALLVLIIVLVAIVAFASLPAAREQLPTWLQPRAFPAEARDETLIVIATFHRTEGTQDVDAHNEIRRAIAREAQTLDLANLRIEVAPESLEAHDRAGAEALGARYDASLVIWGADTGVRVTVHFYNRKQPELDAADVRIDETARTQIAAPSEYADFVTQDLPGQLTFLAFFAVGQTYYAEEAYAESARVIERAVAVLERQTDVIEGAAEAYFRLGWLYHVPLNEIDKATDKYTRALELNPELAEAYNNRGVTYNEIGEYAKAEADYTRALELNPAYAEAYNNRGNNYRDMGEYTKALADFERAAELMSHPVIYYNGAIAHAHLDHPEEACAWLEEAITLHRQVRDFAREDSDFDPIREEPCFQALMKEE
jgi:tetratricopeptide (TPR) repeat protein